MKFDLNDIKEGEIWLWNVSVMTDGSIRESEWKKGQKELFKTLREGNQALDIDGRKLPPAQIRPQYIHKSEYDDHMRWLDEKWQQYLRSKY